MNNWANPSRASAQEVAEMASSLENRAQALDQVQVNIELMNVLHPVSGEHLLEVGCGTGVLCRQMAPAVALGGKVTGFDISVEFVRIASARSKLSNSFHWGVGQAENLPFPDSIFDGGLAARLLLHVSNPQIVLAEFLRVVRPGGRVVVMDWDFETLTVDHSNRSLTRRILHWRCDHYGGNNWRGRQLWRLMETTGFVNVKVAPYVSLAFHENDSLTQSVFRAAQVARDEEAITQSEYSTWVEELTSSLEADCFCASIVYFIVIGERQLLPIM